MKPKPFASLNHLTVPVAIAIAKTSASLTKNAPLQVGPVVLGPRLPPWCRQSITMFAGKTQHVLHGRFLGIDQPGQDRRYRGSGPGQVGEDFLDADLVLVHHP